MESLIDEEALETVRTKQSRLLDFLLHKRCTRDALAELSVLVDTPFAVINFHGRVIFNNTGLRASALIEHWPWETRPIWLRIEGVPFLRKTLARGDTRVGNILFKDTRHTISAAEAELLAHVAGIVAMAIAVSPEPSTPDTDADSFARTLERYCTRELSLESVLEHAAHLGIAMPASPFCCALATHRGTRDAALSEIDLEPLVQHVAAFLHIDADSIVRFRIGPATLVIVPQPTGISAGTMRCALTNALDRCTGIPDRDNWRIAVSSRKSELRDLPDACDEAFDVARAAKGLGYKGAVFMFGEFEFVLLFEGATREHMARYTRSVLKSLPASSQPRDRKLMESLEAYIEHEGRVLEAASAIGVHKNTLAYRLDKLAETLGIDFSKTTDLLRVKLAFILLKILYRTELTQEPRAK
ncbi:PucR family transcriptional regulator [Cupriavidus nantongensis]|uniref:PucR family transcriptional regulator n=1 Tax=Cupriavidus nantongensis TaxID=1796606 RepID=UPI00358DEFDE